MKLHKTKTLNKTIFVVFLVISSGTSFMVSSALSIFIMFAFVFLYKYKKTQNKYMYNIYAFLVLFILFYGFGVFFQFGLNPNLLFLARYIFAFLLVAVLVIAYKDSFFDYLEKAIYFLAIVSLILFGIQLIQFSFVFEPMKSFFNILPIDKGFYFSNRKYFASIFIYTINQNTTSFIDQRNCGFVYEPGYFSFFTNFGLLLALAKYNLAKKRRLIVYLLAIITTFSTTGMIGLIIVIALYFMNTTSKLKILFIPVIISAIILFFNISYGYDKIEYLMSSTKEVHEYQLRASSGTHGISMGRFAGFQYYALETLNTSPYFGLSLLGWKHEINIGIANGTAHFIRNFGFIGLALMIFATFASAKIISKHYLKYKYSVFLFIFIHLYLFAFPFSNLPIFMIFLVMPFIFKKEKQSVQAFSNL
jgi:hypothetical protein